MDFDSMDETITMGSKDLHHHHHSMIMKGKRTKRPRQPSPASAVFTASSCSSGGGNGPGKPPSKIRSSESLCSEISTTTDEDEDMANCLILLAQSGHENTMSTPTHVSSNIENQEKINSRKLKELTITTSSTVVGKAGIYVYECKTCNRSFSSFQALGGHRTSHKKHKPPLEMEDKKPKILPPSNDHHHHHHQEEEEEGGKGKKFLKTSPSSFLPIEIGKKSYHGGIVINSNNNKVKIHECSICGAEFSSGQALGGHMRRHRNPASATTSTTEASHDGGGERPRNNILELDLNLPAPAEDEHHDSQFQLSLFSSPSLVDCQ